MAAWRLVFPLLLLLSELWSKTETDNVTLEAENSTDETSPTGTLPTGTPPSETSLPGTSPSGTSPSRTPHMRTEESAGELGEVWACTPLSFEANYPLYRLFCFDFFCFLFKIFAHAAAFPHECFPRLPLWSASRLLRHRLLLWFTLWFRMQPWWPWVSLLFLPSRQYQVNMEILFRFLDILSRLETSTGPEGNGIDSDGHASVYLCDIYALWAALMLLGEIQGADHHL